MENKSHSIKSTKYYIKNFLQWVEAILIALIVSLLIRAYVFELVRVDGPSMNNTLATGETLFVFKASYLISPPKRGDIIVLQYKEGFIDYIPFIEKLPFLKRLVPELNEIDYIKRVIGLPGEQVDIKDGYVYIDGKKLDEHYAIGKTQPRSMLFPVTVPENKVFVLGDNREVSSDSRQFGFVNYKKIKGKAVFRLLPLNKIGMLK